MTLVKTCLSIALSGLLINSSNVFATDPPEKPAEEPKEEEPKEDDKLLGLGAAGDAFGAVGNAD